MTITSWDPSEQPAELARPSSPLPEWVALLAPAAELAERLADTEFVPTALRRRPAAITAAILYGYEIGVGPMQALRSIDVVQGRPTPSAELLRAMILAAGHELWVVEASATRVTVGGRRVGASREHTVTWTSEMARAAGLNGKDTWRKFPRQMLMARATSELARSIFPDAIRGLGSLDDVADVPAVDLDVLADSTDNQKTVRRPRRRTLEAPAPATPDNGSNPPDPSSVSSTPPDEAVTGAGAVSGEPMGVTGAITVGRDQLARMNIAFRDLGVEDRDMRLRMASGVVGRKLASSTELSKDEASAVITALDDSQSLGIPVPTWPDDDNPV